MTLIDFAPHKDYCKCDDCVQAWEESLAQAVVIQQQRQREAMQQSYEGMFAQLDQLTDD